MTQALIDNLPLIAAAPDGIKALRGLILDLAVRGKLVPQDPQDEPASELLKRIAAEKVRLVGLGKAGRQKASRAISASSPDAALPQTWQWSQLAEVGFISPRNDGDDDQLASFVPMSLIAAEHGVPNGHEVRPWGEIKQGYTHFAEGDVGLAKITPCFENGKSTVFRNLTGGFGSGTTELHIVRPVIIEPDYILLFLKSPSFVAAGVPKMTGTAGQKRIPSDYFAYSPFPLPPLAEQRRIVAKVDELMALCDRLQAQQADAEAVHATLVKTLLDTLTQSQDADDFATNWHRLSQHFPTIFTTEASVDALKQALLRMAVRGKLVLQDPRDEPASELLKRIETEKQRLIGAGILKRNPSRQTQSFAQTNVPQSWSVVCIGDVIGSIDSGWSPACLTEPSPSEDIWGVLKTTAVQPLRYIESENKHLPSSLSPRPEYEVKAGDILITRAGPKNRVGVSCLVLQTRPRLMISDKIIRIHVVGDSIDARFVCLSMNVGITAEFLEASKSGMAESQMNISQEKLRVAPLAVPPLAEQQRIVAKVDELLALCDTLKAQITESRTVQRLLAVALIDQTLAA
ncbi:restriction endonuclease subunit S [Novispirillum itersonii]|uniref:Type I restriction enzyme S subunit n=1 Tax=Novispirillum itersonii TaxID=189 RepID=A0A7W9ZKS0_NOVIT|nr:restriction endonuclease subunit S [Novispirillum itersonii]MBB6212039.1 type I restriction enzyme S subunit [Novispirillum itersonii]